MPIHIKPACKAPSHLSFLGRNHLLNAAHLPSPAAKAPERECLPKCVKSSAFFMQCPMAQQKGKTHDPGSPSYTSVNPS